MEGRTNAAAELERKLRILSSYGTAYMSLRDNLYSIREQSNLLNEKLQQARVDTEQNIPEKFIVDRAFPAEKKSYPIRWIIVAGATISSLIISLITIILLENIKKIEQMTGKA